MYGYMIAGKRARFMHMLFDRGELKLDSNSLASELVGVQTLQPSIP